MENRLSEIFQSDYNRKSFADNVLKSIFSQKVKDFSLYDQDSLQEIELLETYNRTAKKVIKYGEFITHDNRKVELYEVTVEDFRKVKIARVGLRALVKELIIGNHALFAVFKYENVTNRHWRFSFIAYNSSFKDGQVQTEETHPKRYTYVFGDAHETYHTAIDRFEELDHKSQIKLEDIQEAFAVEAMSKAFFDEYRETHYAKFVRFLTGEEFQKKGGKFQLIEVQKPSPFLNSVFNGDKKKARDFCKKLLGQIVFLYFLQKKGWLGASNTHYKEGNGDKNFLQNFYKQAGENDAFYSSCLSKLFYDTLNKKRAQDDFTMPDGTTVKIPYLNGGLFEKESEKFDYLTFPSKLFTDLFAFFNRFNFTIDENSPEEHTVAVDPEMLGHIFENLLEDHKDKGAFYTPKEIVQYMTQESLIAYLVTHLGDETGLRQLIKQKDKEALTENQLREINILLDNVKICDPAIGSGAFPMGLLKEIFALKERIAFDLGFKVWSPAVVKEAIIKNSIYGVDIEKGAVDIARLRFWLSLIVDEEVPKPLPNLAYKIVVGNALVSKFGNETIEIDWEIANGTQGNIFESPHREKIQKLLRQISEKQKEYFTADNKDKPRLAKAIRLLKLKILSEQLTLMINTKGFKKEGTKKLSKAQAERWLETQGWKRTLHEINTLKTNNKPFNHFDWRLDFPEILNPIVNENTGFDIVIGNPPYIKERDNAHIFKPINESPFGKKWHQGKMDFWFYFLHKSIDITKKEGKISFITSRYWLNSQGASKLIERVKRELSFLNIVDIGKLKVFDNVVGHHMIHIYNKGESEKFLYKSLSEDVKHINYDFKTKYVNIDYFKNSNIFKSGEIILSNSLFYFDKSIPLGSLFYVCQGVVEASDKVSSKQYTLKGGNAISVGDGIFVLSQIELNKAGLSINNPLIKRYVDPNDVNKYKLNLKEPKFLIYSDKINKELIANNKKYELVKKHLDLYSDYITSSNAPYGLHRPRKKEFFTESKIIFKIMFKEPEFTFDDTGVYFGFSFSSIINKPNNKNIGLKYLLAILNSKLANAWFNTNGKQRGAGVDIGVNKLRNFPLIISNKINLSIIVDYLLYLNKIDNVDLKSKLTIAYFEQIIDGMVYELYFPELLKKHNRTIMEHIGNLPAFTETMSNNEKKAIIKAVFKRLDNKEHPVRNNLFYMRNIEEIAVIEELKK